jgi:transposase
LDYVESMARPERWFVVVGSKFTSRLSGVAHVQNARRSSFSTVPNAAPKLVRRDGNVKDAEWIADLLCHGTLRFSFVPPKPIRELRDLTRYRRKLVESRSAERNRLLKLLETANIKLASVVTDVFGVSGQLMLHALVRGSAPPQQMAELAKGLLRKKIPKLELALEGKVEEHHRFLLSVQLRRLQAVEEDLGLLA